MSRIQAQFRLQRPGFLLEVAFDVGAKGVTALFGHSGSGKTTLLRCLAGLERADGYLHVSGETWQDDARGVFLPTHARPLGYVFQGARLFAHLTAHRNLEYGWRRLPRDRRPEVEPVVELLGLAPLLGRYPHQLSGGEQQRVAIGRALLTDPHLLLLDEPLSALDRARKEEILPYLERLRDGLEIPIVYVSHDLDEVTRLADQLIFLENGRMVASGALAELLSRLDLPLAREDNAASVVDTVVAGHDDEFGLSHLDFRGGRFHVARIDRAPGKSARVRIHARDVSLALHRPRETSILNLIPATVAEIRDTGAVQVTVRLDAGGTPLLSRITRKSCATLGLTEGKPVFAQVKSVALAD
jgi:molybdate transport system ATP-binding protein